MEVEARYWKRLENSEVQCQLCPMACRMKAGQAGVCRSRYNRDGTMVLNNYGQAVTLAIDPIEKKPLYHFHPNTGIVSTGPNGCNLGCQYCQNWSISQEEVSTSLLTPEQLVTLGGRKGSIGVAFTYTEPLIWFEYLLDVAPLLREAGQKVVLVTNGYLNHEPLRELLPWVDAANIDLKSMRDSFYRKVCKGKLQPVLDSIAAFYAAGVHLELTYLIIPGYNDSDSELADLSDFVSSLSDSIPLHLSAYHPSHHMEAPPTPKETMKRAKDIADKRLKYVFVGNMALPGMADSFCANCHELLIERNGYHTRVVGVSEGCCTKCGAATGIVM